MIQKKEIESLHWISSTGSFGCVPNRTLSHTFQFCSSIFTVELLAIYFWLSPVCQPMMQTNLTALFDFKKHRSYIAKQVIQKPFGFKIINTLSDFTLERKCSNFAESHFFAETHLILPFCRASTGIHSRYGLLLHPKESLTTAA